MQETPILKNASEVRLDGEDQACDYVDHSRREETFILGEDAVSHGHQAEQAHILGQAVQANQHDDTVSIARTKRDVDAQGVAVEIVRSVLEVALSDLKAGCWVVDKSDEHVAVG